jgi:hypothetical protein
LKNRAHHVAEKRTQALSAFSSIVQSQGVFEMPVPGAKNCPKPSPPKGAESFDSRAKQLRSLRESDPLAQFLLVISPHS